MEKELILFSNDEFFDYIVHYICSEENISKKINKFKYLSESTLKPFEYRRRGDKELKINDTELDLESLKTPQLHNKYMKHLTKFKLMLSKAECDYNTLKKDKWEYYTGKAPAEV